MLPSEAELSAEFDASRVTIRRALELVRDEGLIDARQGFGWFVSSEPVRQHLETLGTIEAQLEDSGRHAERRVEEFAFASAPERVAAVLGVTDVLRVKRVNLADGEPFAVVTVWCPADLGRSLSLADVAERPFYELLGVELRGALLRCERVTTDARGNRVLMSEHRFPAHLTEFVVDLPQAAPSLTPSGLRLVE